MSGGDLCATIRLIIDAIATVILEREELASINDAGKELKVERSPPP